MQFIFNIFLSFLILAIYYALAIAIDYYMFKNTKTTDKIFKSKMIYYFISLVLFTLVMRILLFIK